MIMKNLLSKINVVQFRNKKQNKKVQQVDIRDGHLRLKDGMNHRNIFPYKNTPLLAIANKQEKI